MKPWKDITSYSRGRDRTPRSCQCEVGALDVVVTRHIHYPDDAWVLRCALPGLNEKLLQSTKLEEAQAEALSLIRDMVRDILMALGEDHYTPLDPKT